MFILRLYISTSWILNPFDLINGENDPFFISIVGAILDKSISLFLKLEYLFRGEYLETGL